MVESSEIQSIYFILPIIGLIVGLIGTMVGGGGGFIFFPVLTLIFNVPAQIAVITTLVATLPICLVGSYGHYLKNNINFKIALILISGGIIGILAGINITNWITERQLRIAFGIYSILIAINLVLFTHKKKDTRNVGCETGKSPSLLSVIKGSFYGLVAGLITGTFGTSGTAPIIAGLFSMGIPLKIIIGTSLIVVVFNTVFATVAYFFIGEIDLTLVSFLTAGSVIGAMAGPQLLSKIKLDKAEKSAGYWYAAFMIIIGVLMIIKLK